MPLPPMQDTASSTDTPARVFLAFLQQGLTAFGGPVAHLASFHHEFVQRRRWLGEAAYADLVALCQILPGPASSQVGMALGFTRAGYAGALAAWAGFTLPSALTLMVLAGLLVAQGQSLPAGLLAGLKVAVVAVVAQAVWGMGRQLCTDAPRITVMVLACCLSLVIPHAGGQVAAIVLAAGVGALLIRPVQARWPDPLAVPISRRAGSGWLILFSTLLLGLPVLSALFPGPLIALVDTFYRSGALVFGGGHVVLPLLHAELVTPGLLTADVFVAGYGATQAMPGPLFSFAAFLGHAINTPPNGGFGGMLALLAIFTPSFLLVAGTLPFWESVRQHPAAQNTLAGVHAGVVGLLLAALYQPVWTSAILAPRDLAFAWLALLALMVWRLPVWAVVPACALAGSLAHAWF